MSASRRHPRLWLTLALTLILTVGLTSAVLAGGPRANPTFDSQGPLNAIATWTHGFDGDDVDMMMSAFSDDPTFVFVTAPDADPFVFEGREAVEALFTDAIEDQVEGEVRRHVTTNHLVEQVDRDTARVTSYLTLLQLVSGQSEDPAVISNGVYTDTLERGRDGVWRIDHRELVLDTPTSDDAEAPDAFPTTTS